jgi:transcription termination factor NusB
MAKGEQRSAARLAAVQALYQMDIAGTSLPDTLAEFESHWMQHVGAKEAAIRDRFALSPARYYQLLGALIDSPSALAHDPMLIKRLQRTRDARLSARGAPAPRTDG